MPIAGNVDLSYPKVLETENRIKTWRITGSGEYGIVAH